MIEKIQIIILFSCMNNLEHVFVLDFEKYRRLITKCQFKFLKLLSTLMLRNTIDHLIKDIKIKKNMCFEALN